MRKVDHSDKRHRVSLWLDLLTGGCQACLACSLACAVAFSLRQELKAEIVVVGVITCYQILPGVGDRLRSGKTSEACGRIGAAIGVVVVAVAFFVVAVLLSPDDAWLTRLLMDSPVFGVAIFLIAFLGILCAPPLLGWYVGKRVFGPRMELVLGDNLEEEAQKQL